MNPRNIAWTLLGLVACNSAPPSAGTTTSSSAAAPPSSAASSASAAPAAASAAPETTKPKHPTVPLPAITWTKTPSIADAPATTAVADANGLGVEMPVAELNRIDGQWTLQVEEGKNVPWDQRQMVKIYLKEPPATGAKPTAAFARNLGLFQLIQPKGKGTTSYNADNAWAIEFTSVEMKPYDKKDKGIQVVGTAKGRLIVMYELTGEGYKSSWAAGAFEAPIRLWDDKLKPAKK